MKPRSTTQLAVIGLIGLAICSGAYAERPGAVPPLLDDDGAPLVSIPRAVPPHPAQRTRSGLYATEAQALALEHALPGQVISVRARCCGEPGLDEAMLSAWHQYVAYDAPADIPVLVRGDDRQNATRLSDRLDDLQRAARLTDRLSGAGFAPVFLVSVP